MANSNPGFVDGQTPDASVWNAAFTNKVDASFGTLTNPTVSGVISGAPTMSANPTVALGIATKGYVDTAVATPAIYSMAASGATGNGVTDDQPVIQAWLNNLTHGAEVLLPPGAWYYIHTAPLVIPPNVVIRGAYSAKDNNIALSSTMFDAGGFYIDPTLPVGIIMRAATALLQCKVYRSGLVANPSNATAEAAYTTWANEGVYAQTNGAITSGATTIPLVSTSGISVGMQVSGQNGAYNAPSSNGVWVPNTVTAVNPGVSVTISSPGITGNFASGVWFRFGASLGIAMATNCSGIVIQDCEVVGFRTGIQSVVAQFQIDRCRGDCITNIELASGGDFAVIRDCEWLPLYGAPVGTNFVRPGDMVFCHDMGGGPGFQNCFGIGWQIGWHFENAANACTDCGNEVPTGAGPGTINWWLHGGASQYLKGCHAQAGGIGYLIDGCNQFLLSDCTSSGSQATGANNTAHFMLQNTGAGNMYGALANPMCNAGYPNKLPFKFGSGTVNAGSILNPVILDTSGAASTPYISGSLPGTFAPDLAQGTAYQGNRASGGTTVLLNYWNGVIFDSSVNPIATHTITLPPYPIDCQVVTVNFNIGVTTITWNTSDGSAVGNYTNPAAGTLMRAVYNAAQNKWYIAG